jgi:methionine-gamma-lyase
LRKKTSIRFGGTISPFNAWLIIRGLATLPLRMRVHQENALKIASYLEQNPKVKRVIYPGLASHPQHELAKQQMKNFSGMVTFQLKDIRNVQNVAEKLQIIHYAVSLGHHRSLVFYLASENLLQTSFKFATPEQYDSWNTFAGEGIFRLSAGLENAEDLIADLEQAID